MPVSPTGRFKQSLDSFNVTDSPLSVTNLPQMAMFHIKVTSLNDFSLEDERISSTGQFILNKVLTVSMFHIVL